MKRTPLDPRTLSLATRAIHGRHLEARQAPVSTPIVQTSTYRFASSNDAVRYAAGDPEVYVYSRYHNPTVREAEERLALMMESEKALLFSSGMAAISAAVLSVANAGDEIVSTPALYGGTYRFFRDILPHLGITVSYSAPQTPEDVGSLLTPKTRVVYLETPTNPTLSMVDIGRLVAAVRRREKEFKTGITIIADNTFATVLNQNPFHYGVDMVVESATKYLGGHSDFLAGVVAGPGQCIRQAHVLLKYFGGCSDPFAAYLLLRSLQTFELRVERQNRNALQLARFLERRPEVRRVLYPGLRSHPSHKLARRQMPGGFGGMLTIELRGSARKAAAVCDALQVAVNAMSLGSTKTLVSIPVYSSHVAMTRAELERQGVVPGMIRISTGIEDIRDLQEDFARALRSAGR